MNRYNKRYRLGLLNAFANWLDDLRWKWCYHGDAFLCGVATGVFAVTVAAYFVWGLTCN